MMKRDSIITKDTVYTPIPNEERWIADDTKTHKKSKWQLLAAGSLGTTLAQIFIKNSFFGENGVAIVG